MKGYFFRFLIIGLTLFSFTGILAQENASTRKVEGKEGEFIVHTVEAKQTLYAISKMYSVSVEDIQKSNPELENTGIKIGQTLRIPVKRINKKEVKRSVVTISADTIYHKVVKKETLYGLTKKYEVSEQELLKYNPSLKDGLKLDMVVKIPVNINTVDREDEMEFEVSMEDSLILHEVLPKETLYSLSKKYGVTPDSIQIVNEGLKEGLKIGATIRIPLPNPNFSVKRVDSILTDSSIVEVVEFKDTLKIAVFVPFCSVKNLQMQEVNENEELYILTKISLEFMRGMNKAVDSLTTRGHHVEVKYFDTENDTNTCKKLCTQEELSNYHFFVGPMFQVNFKILAEKAKSLGVPIISPVKVSSRLLLDNEYVFKSLPSSPSLVINEAQYMGRQFADSNVVLFSGGAAKDKRAAEIYQKYLSNTVGDSIPNHRVWQTNIDNFKRHLKLGEVNTVAIVSSDEAFVSSALSHFYGLQDEETHFTVFGMDSWENFGSIDFDYLTELNVVYSKQQYVDYSSELARNFVNGYRQEYFSDPSIHVFSAFDIGWYFGNMFYESDGDWKNSVSSKPYSGLSLKFDFVKVGAESGYENRGGFLLQYSTKGLNLVH